jgi:hypothetical protein
MRYEIRLRRTSGEQTTITAKGTAELSAAITVLRRISRDGDLVEAITLDDNSNILGTCDVTTRSYTTPISVTPREPLLPQPARTPPVYRAQRFVDAARAAQQARIQEKIIESAEALLAAQEASLTPTIIESTVVDSEVEPTQRKMKPAVLRVPGALPSQPVVDETTAHVDLTDTTNPEVPTVNETPSNVRPKIHAFDVLLGY